VSEPTSTTAPQPIETIARYDVGTETWVAQDWNETDQRWRDIVPVREATEDEIDRAVEMPDHPGWGPISASRDTPHHWLTFFHAISDEPDHDPLVQFHCDAPEGADCRFTCEDGCDAFPCRHAPAPSDCWAEPWISGNRATDVMLESAIDEHGHVDNALAHIDWEGDYAVASYQEGALGVLVR
jgi:hypothetical protein